MTALADYLLARACWNASLAPFEGASEPAAPLLPAERRLLYAPQDPA